MPSTKRNRQRTSTPTKADSGHRHAVIRDRRCCHQNAHRITRQYPELVSGPTSAAAVEGKA